MVYASQPYSCRVQCYDSGERNEHLEKKTRVCTCNTLQIGKAALTANNPSTVHWKTAQFLPHPRQKQPLAHGRPPRATQQDQQHKSDWDLDGVLTKTENIILNPGAKEYHNHNEESLTGTLYTVCVVQCSEGLFSELYLPVIKMYNISMCSYIKYPYPPPLPPHRESQ